MLIVFGGRAGTGKTTLAKDVAKALRAVYLRVDAIEEAIRSCDVLTSNVGSAGYVVGYAVAAENLRLGATVVADSVNPLTVTRDSWVELAAEAGCAAVEVEVICSDAEEHRRRLEAREAMVEEPRRLTREHVMAREYDEWTRTRILLDTAKTSPEEALAELLRVFAVIR